MSPDIKLTSAQQLQLKPSAILTRAGGGATALPSPECGTQMMTSVQRTGRGSLITCCEPRRDPAAASQASTHVAEDSEGEAESSVGTGGGDGQAPRFGGSCEQKPKTHTWAGGALWNPGRPPRFLAVGCGARFCDRAAGRGAVLGVGGWAMPQSPCWLCLVVLAGAPLPRRRLWILRFFF